uniref:Bm647, isoform e n=1 Tax=Brugia malayi TaxID=6279 RepID=A0A1I9G4D5_BRUMA|nr:Bm647, isoform e [Brugia malayi]
MCVCVCVYVCMCVSMIVPPTTICSGNGHALFMLSLGIYCICWLNAILLLMSRCNANDLV